MDQISILTSFATDTLQGLSHNPKYLLPKYFYDDRGSRIFQEIMKMPEYYLTRCEMEILSNYKAQISEYFTAASGGIELIELGSGDGVKTEVLLKTLTEQQVQFSYIPIDISTRANEELVQKLNETIPSLRVNAKSGDYFQVLQKMNGQGNTPKVILFLGANIGNFSKDELKTFFHRLSGITRKGDKVLIGFDLKKSPEIIMNAYHDPHGHTKNFNLNHLLRINRELDADFDTRAFLHHPSYNPLNGEMKSFLISTRDQSVHLKELETIIYFKKWEAVYMEMSRKFDTETIHMLAEENGFRIIENFTDSANYFVDSLWIRK